MPRAASSEGSKPKKGPAKCRPPVGLKTHFCVALDAVIIGHNERRAGIYILQLMKFSTGKERVVGVAARRSAKDRPVMFNRCPFCGEEILWLAVKAKKGKRS